MSEQFLILVAVIGGIVEIAKRLGMKSRFAPLTSLVVGMVCTYFFIGTDTTTLLGGVIASLTAGGVYSGVKTSVSATK